MVWLRRSRTALITEGEFWNRGSGRLADDQEALLPDLHIDPIDGNVQSCDQLCGAERSGRVGPAVTLRRYPDPGTEPDPLHRDRQNLVGAIGRAVPRVRRVAISSSGMPAFARSSRWARIS